MDTHWFSDTKGLKRFAIKGIRVAGAALMAVSLLGPLQPPAAPAHAKDLEWSDFRPPMTDEADTTETNGFVHLPDYGMVRHSTVVAPNGDVFTAGTGADVNADGIALCGVAPVAPSNTITDYDQNANGAACDAAAANRPVVFRSTDGGKKWRGAAVLGAGAAATGLVAVGAVIQKIVVSSKYPTDNFVGVAFSGAAASGANGFAWSTDGGLSFTTASINGAEASTGTFNLFASVIVRTVALSPDFNFNDGSGSMAIGGGWVANTATGFTTTVSTFKAAVQGNQNSYGGTGVWTAIVQAADDFDYAGTAVISADGMLDLAYTANEEPVALAAIYVDGDDGIAVCGAIVTAGAVPDCTAASVQRIAGGAATNMTAVAGQTVIGRVWFDDIYTSGGSFFASFSQGVGTAGVLGGVFRFNGAAWERKTPAAGTQCGGDVSDMVVSGNGSSVKIVAALLGSNQVCRSTNEGSSWSKAEADGGDTMCDQCRISTSIAAVPSTTTVAGNRTTPNTIFWATSADATGTTASGGLAMSTDLGSSWMDTGLTNAPFIAGSTQEADANRTFNNAAVGTTGCAAGAGCERSAFWTENWGTGAAWRRSLRYTGSDATIGPLPGSFLTDNTMIVTRGTQTAGGTSFGATTDNLLKTSDGGRTWKKTTSDPFASGPDTNELITANSIQSGSVFFIGGNKGHVSTSTDGGASWTLLAKDFGEGVDEFDFVDPARTMFIVTGQDSDNVRKLWWTGDSGATFTQIGDGAGAWGTGNPNFTGFSTAIEGLDATGKGTVLALAGAGVSTADLFRFDLSKTGSTWVDGDTDTTFGVSTTWSSMFAVRTPGTGDGVTVYLSRTSAGLGDPQMVRSVYPFTSTSSDWSARQAMTTQRSGNGGGAQISSCKDAARCYQYGNAGRVQDIVFTPDFLAGPTVSSPANNGSLPTNVGNDGIPAVFRWNSVGKANCYDIQISLDNNFRNPTFDGTATGFTAGACGPTGAGVSTGSSYQVTAAIFALVTGQQYWWRTRVRATDASVIVATAAASGGNAGAMAGPWSPVSAFTVSTTSPTVNVPQPSLPLNNSQLPGLSTQLSWNNPPGVTQVQIQVTPNAGDGPAINLIFGSAISGYDVPAPVFGTGPYVILPGALYTWRLRVTGSSTAVGEFDPSWGPWSEPRSFTTAKPNAGTIQLVDPINGKVVTTTTPSVNWKDANPAMFYYEIQLSADPNFGEQGAKASVFWNLIHGGQATPPNSWKVPDANALPKGTYSWRVRQRLQATVAGQNETGIPWSPTQSFVVQ